MSANADNLPIEDVFPAEVPASQPVDPPVAEPAPVPEPVAAPQDKAPQQIPPDHVPRWRLNEVLEQNRALKAQIPQPQAQPQQPATQAPKEEDYDNFPAFESARLNFIAEQAAEKKWNDLQQRSHQEAQQRSFHDRVSAADNSFSTKLYEAANKNPALMEKISNAPTLRQDLQLVLKEAEVPVALAEHLADNPALVLQLNQMPPDKAIREITRMEMKLTTVTGGPSKMPSAKAPNLDPVGGGNSPAPKNVYSPQSSEEDYIAATRRRK